MVLLFHTQLSHCLQISENDNVPVVSDMVRAAVFRTSLQILRQDQPVWLYSWELDGHLFHAGDTPFLVGLHPITPDNATWKETLMLKYMPNVLRDFVKNGNPDRGMTFG